MSKDNGVYISDEVFTARMERLEAIIERNLAVTRADIAEFKAFVEKSNSELKAEISSVRTELKAEIAEVRSEVRVQTTRIDSLVHWNYWIIAVFVAFFMMPSVIEGVRGVFRAISTVILSIIKKKDSR